MTVYAELQPYPTYKPPASLGSATYRSIRRWGC